MKLLSHTLRFQCVRTKAISSKPINFAFEITNEKTLFSVYLYSSTNPLHSRLMMIVLYINDS